MGCELLHALFISLPVLFWTITIADIEIAGRRQDGRIRIFFAALWRAMSDGTARGQRYRTVRYNIKHSYTRY